jgi:hypothetical protein
MYGRHGSVEGFGKLPAKSCLTASISKMQIPAPDGSTAADEELGPGRVFVVPRYFPLAQKVRRIIFEEVV